MKTFLLCLLVLASIPTFASNGTFSESECKKVLRSKVESKIYELDNKLQLLVLEGISNRGISLDSYGQGLLAGTMQGATANLYKVIEIICKAQVDAQEYRAK